MARAPFLCPSVLRDSQAAPLPAAAPDATPEPWLFNGVVGEDVDSLLLAADPLIVALHLAGYMTVSAVFAFSEDVLIHVDLESMAVTEEESWEDRLGRDWPAGATAVLGLYVEPRKPFAGIGDIPSVDLSPLRTIAAHCDFSQEKDGWLFVAASAPVGDIADAFIALEEPLTVAKDAVIDALLENSGTSLESCGLLGMYNPAKWTFAKPGTDSTSLTTLATWVFDAITDPALLGLPEFLKRDLSDGAMAPFYQRMMEAKKVDDVHGKEICGRWQTLVRKRYARLHGKVDQTAAAVIELFPSIPYTQVLMHLHAYGIADVIAVDDIPSSAPEWTTPDVTGFYFRWPTTRKNLDTLQINQAGLHITGRWQRHYTSDTKVRTFGRFELEGDLRGNDEAGGLRFIGFTTEYDGNISLQTRVDGDDLELTITFEDGHTETYRRANTNAFLEEGAVTRLSAVNAAFGAAQNSPLHPAEVYELRLAKKTILDWLEAYYSFESESSERLSYASNMDAEVAKALTSFVTVDTALNVTPGDQAPLAMLLLRQAMMDTEVTTIPGDRRNLWRWLEALLADEARGAVQPTKRMQAIFAYHPDGAAHLYQWSFEGDGISGEVLGGASYMQGPFTISKYEGTPEHPTKILWTKTYQGRLVGGSLGVGFGVEFGVSDSGWIESAVDWKPQNFSGWLGTVGGQAGAGAEPIDPNLPDVVPDPMTQAQLIIFSGDGTFESVVGYSAGQNDVKNGVFYGVDAGGRLGKIWLEESLPPEGDPAEAQPIHGLTSMPSGQDGHFAVDSAALNEAGRQRLREVCATYRALLEGAGGTLEVIGHASRSGRADYNYKLSAARAQAVYQAIRDILGPGLAVPEERTTVEGRGEQEATEKNDADGTENPQRRRVDVSIDGVVVSHLWS